MRRWFFLARVVFGIALALVVVLAARAAPDRETLLLASAAALVAVVAFGKVFSPQFLVWLVPLVPLVGAFRGAICVVLLLGALVVTHLWFLEYVTPFDLDREAWLVVARDAAIVAMFALLVQELGRRARAPTAIGGRTTAGVFRTAYGGERSRNPG